jgi:cytochrome c biogenesis protein CcdA
LDIDRRTSFGIGKGMLSLVLALLAGIVTIAAPCTLPVLPILLGASIGRASNLRPVMIALGFIASFTSAALLLSLLTRAFDFDATIVRDGAALALLVFGFLMIWPAPFEAIAIRVRGLSNSTSTKSTFDQTGNLGGFLLGLTLGLVWTPCAGPVLGSILALVATSKNLGWASLQLLFYAIGAAVPMLAIAYGGQRVTTRVRSFAKFAPRLQQGFGVIVIAFAAAMYFQYDTLFVSWLTQNYPTLQLSL